MTILLAISSIYDRSSVTISFRKILLGCKAFTLIELLVVVAILVLLASLAVATFGHVLLRARRSATFATLVELDRVLVAGGCCTDHYPSGWDSLLEGQPGSGSLAIFSRIPGGPNGPLATSLSVVMLPGDEVAALANRGITNSYLLSSNNVGSPFYPNITCSSPTSEEAYRYSSGDPSVLYPFVSAPASMITNLFYGVTTQNQLYTNYTTTPISLGYDCDFIVLGLGGKTTAIGPDGFLLQPPIHPGSSDPLENPVDFYERYCAIFRLCPDPQYLAIDQAASAQNDGAVLPSHWKASFVGFVALTSHGMISAEKLASLQPGAR